MILTILFLKQQFISFRQGISIIKKRSFKKILHTPSFDSNPSASVEIHSLISHNDISMYLLAIKSFLRFYSDVSLVVHDDGTLTKKDINLLQEHLKNVRVINKESADIKIKSFLKDKTNCMNFRQSYINSMQVFDYYLFSNKNKIISFDSDILFLKEPKDIIDWIKNQNKEVLYNAESDLPHNILFEQENIPELKNLNCGFMCFYKEFMDYKLIESLLKKVRDKQKEERLWSQAYFSAIFKIKNIETKALPKDKYRVYLNKKKQAEHVKVDGKEVMIHFVNTTRFSKGIYLKLANKVIKELETRECMS